MWLHVCVCVCVAVHVDTIIHAPFATHSPCDSCHLLCAPPPQTHLIPLYLESPVVKSFCFLLLSHREERRKRRVRCQWWWIGIWCAQSLQQCQWECLSAGWRNRWTPPPPNQNTHTHTFQFLHCWLISERLMISWVCEPGVLEQSKQLSIAVEQLCSIRLHSVLQYADPILIL